jgi:hypothetical protein
MCCILMLGVSVIGYYSNEREWLSNEMYHAVCTYYHAGICKAMWEAHSSGKGPICLNLHCAARLKDNKFLTGRVIWQFYVC